LNNNSENIIIDFSHDGIHSRKKVLQNLNFSKVITPINFFTISLRPGANSIIEWDAKRKRVNKLEED
jgi:hypothetical protein